MIKFLRTIPLPIWFLQIILFFTPLFAHTYFENHSNYNDFGHFIIDLVWYIYVFPTIIFAYYFSIKGAVISNLILSLFHIIFEWIKHNGLPIVQLFIILLQLVLIFFVSYAVGLLSKKLSRKNSELEIVNKKLQQMAYYDTLTGLANRRLFIRNLDKELNKENEIAVFFVDLDGFKQINDTFGHYAGDELLKEVANRLKNCVHNKDTLSRLAGDEFIILYPSISYEGTIQVAERILEVLNTPFTIKNSEVKVTPSIGIAFSKNSNHESETLIKHADRAMYKAKKKGKNNFQVYTATNLIK